jgi:hypothetical protein
VVAAEGLTCLVLSAAAPTRFAGRGEGARWPGQVQSLWDPTGADSPAESGAGTDERVDFAMARLDVTDHIDAKVAALCAYRSQFPLEPGMFPDFLLRELFGREYFIQVLPPRRAETELF